VLFRSAASLRFFFFAFVAAAVAAVRPSAAAAFMSAVAAVAAMRTTPAPAALFLPFLSLTAVRSPTALARNLTVLFRIHRGKSTAAPLAVSVGRRAVSVSQLAVPLRFLRVAPFVMCRRLTMMMSGRFVIKCRITMMMRRLTALATDLGHVLAIPANGLSPSSTGLRRFFAVEFMSGPTLVRCPTSFAGNLALLLGIHAGKTTSTTLSHCFLPCIYACLSICGVRLGASYLLTCNANAGAIPSPRDSPNFACFLFESSSRSTVQRLAGHRHRRLNMGHRLQRPIASQNCLATLGSDGAAVPHAAQRRAYQQSLRVLAKRFADRADLYRPLGGAAIPRQSTDVLG
jgi:hypothetical protein